MDKHAKNPIHEALVTDDTPTDDTQALVTDDTPTDDTQALVTDDAPYNEDFMKPPGPENTVEYNGRVYVNTDTNHLWPLINDETATSTGFIKHKMVFWHAFN